MRVSKRQRLTILFVTLAVLLTASPALAFPPGTTNPPGGVGGSDSGVTPPGGGSRTTPWPQCQGTTQVWYQQRNGRTVVVDRIPNSPACPSVTTLYNRNGDPIPPETVTIPGTTWDWVGRPFCHTGYFVWRFYGTKNNPTMHWSRTWVPNQVNCRVERYVFPVPHPADGGAPQSYINNLGWTNRASQGTTHAINYPTNTYRVSGGGTCPVNDNARLFEQFFKDASKASNQPVPSDPNYDEKYAAAAVREGFAKTYNDVVAAAKRDPGVIAAKLNPALLARYILNVNVNTPTIDHWGMDGTLKRNGTINFKDPYPCSSPLDFVYNQPTSDPATDKSGLNRLGPNEIPVYGECWVGVANQYTEFTHRDLPGAFYSSLREDTNAFYYTRASQIQDRNLHRMNPADFSSSPDRGVVDGVTSRYRSFLRENLPSRVPGVPTSIEASRIEQRPLRWVLRREAGRDNPYRLRSGADAWTPQRVADEATCHYGTGAALSTNATTVAAPVFGLTPTTLTAGREAYVAGTSIDWTLATFRAGNVHCQQNCSGIQITDETVTWPSQRQRVVTPDGWTSCDDTRRRAVCNFIIDSSQGDRTLTFEGNFWSATRPNETIRVSAAPQVRVEWRRVTATNSTVLSSNIEWFFSNGGGFSIPISISLGGAVTSGSSTLIGSTPPDHHVRVGGPQYHLR